MATRLKTRRLNLAHAYGFPTGTNNQGMKLYSKKTAAGRNRRTQLANAVKSHRKKSGIYKHNNVSTDLAYRNRNK